MKRNFDFDFESGEFRFKNKNPVPRDGADALRVWVEKCLRTQIGKYAIYKNEQYGANIEDLVVGGSYGSGFTESELRREIEDALTRHDDIESVSNFSLSAAGNKMTINFTLHTAFGEIEEAGTYDL